MKKHKISTLILAIGFLMSMQIAYGQFRILPEYDVPRSSSRGTEPIAGFDPILDPFGNPVEDPNVNEFDFNLRFNSFSILAALERDIARAQRAAVNRWLGRQEETFRREINRQLNSNYSNFRDAQRAFFRNYEKNLLRVNSRAITLSQSRSSVARRLDEEQIRYTSEFFALDEWERSGDFCSHPVVTDKWCDMLKKLSVQGKALTTFDSSLEFLVYRALVRQDFGKKEIDASVARLTAQGLGTIASNDYLVNRFAQNHINYYNSRGLQDKVFLMTAYLTRFFLQAPYVNPNIYVIPQFWSDNTLLTLGKNNAPTASLDVRVFDDNFLNAVRAGQLAPSIPPSAMQSLLDRRERVIQEHIDATKYLQFPAIGKGSKFDPKKELKCFDKTKPAKLTIYIEQAVPGTTKVHGQNEVGHVFVGIEQGQFRRLFGYYPQESATDVGVAVGRNYTAILRDNSGSNYNIKIEKSITAQQLTKVIEEAEDFHKTYNLNNYACVDFGIDIGNLGGMNLPRNTTSELVHGFYPFKGRAPGRLGEDIMRSNSTAVGTATRSTQKAPSKRGNCN
ncbi:MAG: hypothetical protein AAGC64_00040 [Bacteroidota bacterium]